MPGLRARVAARYWLWRHQRHAYLNLTNPWSCSCGSRHHPPRKPTEIGAI